MNTSVGIKPQMGGKGHVTQASDKQEAQSGEHVVRSEATEQKATEAPNAEK